MARSRRAFLEQAGVMGLLYGAQCAFAKAQMQTMPGMKLPKMQDKSHVGPLTQPPKSMLHVLALPAFVDPLPLPQMLLPVRHGNRRSITLTMREIQAKVHRDVPATRMWSYGPEALAPVIEARAGQPLEITWQNHLPAQHFLPIDYSLHGCGHDVPDVRTVAHLHGAKVQSKFDGYPEDWFGVGSSRTCVYPMQQEAAALWFHDHAMGINRLNTYAGLFGMLLLRDDAEDALHLPTGKYEVPLILYDRDFTADGQLFYDTSGDAERPWIPEFSADGLMVNGKLKPFLDVEPRMYRFRLLNAANSRFYLLSLSNGHSFTQIGSDQGLLPAPVSMPRIILGSAERADVLIDFASMAGQQVHLRTGATDMVEFRVNKQATSTVNNTVPHALRPVPRIPEGQAAQTRTITLHEYKSDMGQSMVMLLNRKHWHEPTTEKPKLNSTEIWEFMNLTEDTHPMHIHLVRFQVLDRRPFDTGEYILYHRRRFTSEPQAAPAHEMGWKDVVQCPPGTVTRVIMKFEGFPGKYLYHCHILEHESNDMMRPFEIIV